MQTYYLAKASTAAGGGGGGGGAPGPQESGCLRMQPKMGGKLKT